MVRQGGWYHASRKSDFTAEVQGSGPTLSSILSGLIGDYRQPATTVTVIMKESRMVYSWQSHGSQTSPISTWCQVPYTAVRSRPLNAGVKRTDLEVTLGMN